MIRIEARDLHRLRRARTALVVLATAAFAVACGGGSDKADASAKPKKHPASATANAGASGSQPSADPRLASAVVDGKTTAPVDLKYDLPAKPALGQPFTVELTLQPLLPADALDVEINDAPGLTITGERAARFPAVEAGKAYVHTVQLQGDADGLYYVSVIAKVSTKVQTETRAFSIPVVIGTPAGLQKAAPKKDASGQPVESMPAKEG